MPKYTIKNVTAEADTLDEARWLATAAYLRHIAGIDAPEPTEQEIDALLAELEAEKTERLDLADLGRQVAVELTWLDSTIAGIDGYAAAGAGEGRGQAVVPGKPGCPAGATIRGAATGIKRPAWGRAWNIITLIEPVFPVKDAPL